ncbi:hypothetical protein LshimejAT787_0100790 [Lyophyllum shimeji]|uniref:Uncharacterized protein n=1 Tax=Lyophyllum shimeji TaxID=47721 RepID=A0A9P3PCZ8_LYOSH|nr:hypothetical protein LshimejAT787_0100790 [Lyophyllum shimeji]
MPAWVRSDISQTCPIATHSEFSTALLRRSSEDVLILFGSKHRLSQKSDGSQTPVTPIHIKLLRTLSNASATVPSTSSDGQNKRPGLVAEMLEEDNRAWGSAKKPSEKS